jgi:cytochrome c peroxidase
MAHGTGKSMNEMGNPSVGYVIDKIKALSDYQDLFAQSFNSEVNMLTLGQALASYQRSLVSADSPFDSALRILGNFIFP